MLLKKYLYVLRQLITIFPICLGYLLSKIINQPQSWIFLERGYDAQDNAWILFNYVLESHPEITAYYAVKYNTPTYKSINTHDRLINYGSVRYYMKLYRAKYILSTHVGTQFPSLWLSGKLLRTSLYPNAKYVFLQHGIIHNNILGLHSVNLKHPIDLFICGAKKEYDYVLKNFGYPSDVVKYTGLARFDKLHDIEKKKQILIMPTWRKKYASLNFDEFIMTDYYMSYSSLLTSPKLLEALEKYDYTLMFYNHFEFQKYNSLFEPFANNRVRIINVAQITVQEMLKSSSLLVTDYSSVYYDYIYMEKPVIFFLLNKDEFYQQQYGVDLDDPADFGDVVFSPESLVVTIVESIKSECKMPSKFQENMRKIFILHDANNSSRIVNEVLSIPFKF